MPLQFVANEFVPTDSFPSFWKGFVEWNPVSSVTQTVREIFGNVPEGMPIADAWSMQHPVLYTILWVAVILLVFVPLSVRTYERATAK